MSNQGNGQNVTAQGNCERSTFAYLAAGLGIGAALSIFLAPKSGEESRKWIANKCLDAVDSANEKVRRSRIRAKDALDRCQQQVSETVAAGREAIGKPKAAASQGHAA